MTEIHPLAILREALLSDPDIAAKIKLADQYLQTMTLLGSSFVLPREHADLLPILQYYGDDLTGWCKYVRNMREHLPRGERLAALQEAYRTIEIRRVQRDRRERLSAAVDQAVRLRRIEDVPDVKLAYARKCTQEWAKQRKALLDGIRSGTRGGRVNEDERAVVLDTFWTEIDAGITRGEVP